MSIHRFSWKEPYNPEGKPRAAVVRYGAFGDMAQAASVCAALKAEGFHVTLYASFPASEIVAFDPNIDELLVQMQNQVPLAWLGHFWMWHENKWRNHQSGGKKYDRWINLTESAEVNLLAMAGNITFNWPPLPRHRLKNFNYVQIQHEIAGVGHVKPSFKFHPTDEEKKWRDKERAAMAKVGIQEFILWSLAGSSRTHKLYPHQPAIWQHVLKHFPNWGIATAGDASCRDLEAGFEGEPKIWRTSGKWTIRQVAAMMEIADVVIGPETGVLSMAAFYPQPKVVFLSHSTVENLTRDWVNTTSLWAPFTECPGRGKNEVAACHKMLPSFEGCRRHETFGTAQCCAEILPEWVWSVLQICMTTGEAPPWAPPIL